MGEDWLNAEEKAVWHAWKVAGESVMAGVVSDIQRHAGLSGSDFGVLSRLMDLGQGSCRQQELADSIGWDKSRLSHQLTRMEKRGLLRRRPAEVRGIWVDILSSGREAIDRARPIHARAIRRHLLDPVGETRMRSFRQMLDQLVLANGGEADGAPPTGGSSPIE